MCITIFTHPVCYAYAYAVGRYETWRAMILLPYQRQGGPHWNWQIYITSYLIIHWSKVRNVSDIGQELENWYSEWISAINARDWNKVASKYTPNAILYGPNGNPFNGTHGKTFFYFPFVIKKTSITFAKRKPNLFSEPFLRKTRHYNVEVHLSFCQKTKETYKIFWQK